MNPAWKKTLSPVASRALVRGAATVCLLTFAVFSHAAGEANQDGSDKKLTRAQLSIGYSLLYQEADGIPKLKRLLLFKDKSAEMEQVSHELVGYYQQLAGSMQKLSKQYPAMRIDVRTMPQIESDTRKAIGEDLAKDIAPVVGKSGVKFEREALLTFYDSLNEQRHLVALMIDRETVPALKKFLETTEAQLDDRYAKVDSLLSRHYFTH
jgi:hypothetical protein